MSHEDVTPEVLHAFVYYEDDDHLHQLLDDHPGLAEYVTPLMALFQAIGMLGIVDHLEGKDAEDDGRVVELVSTPEGGIEARPAKRGQRDVEQYVPLLIRAAQGAINFLNEKGYRVLATLAEGEEDPVTRAKLGRYRDALRLCLDRGHNDEWLANREAELEKERYPEETERERAFAAYVSMTDLFMVEDPAALRQLVHEEPWIRVYSAGIPIDFSANQIELRKALAQFCWGRSWAQRYRAVRSNPCLLTPPAWQLLERISELAPERRSERSLRDYWITGAARDDAETLKRCASEDITPVLLEEARNFLVGPA